jgi:hypothetical protein
MNAPIQSPHYQRIEHLALDLRRIEIGEELRTLYRAGARFSIWRSGRIWNVRVWPNGRPADRLDYTDAVHVAKADLWDAISHALQVIL